MANGSSIEKEGGSTTANERLSKRDQILLEEYRAAQESAQHHTNLIYTVMAIIWAGTLALFGFVLQYLNNPELRTLIILLALLGMILIIAISAFFFHENRIIRHQYGRCQEIERELGITLHQDLPYIKGFVRIGYTLITGIFIIIWIFILSIVWCN